MESVRVNGLAWIELDGDSCNNFDCDLKVSTTVAGVGRSEMERWSSGRHTFVK